MTYRILESAAPAEKEAPAERRGEMTEEGAQAVVEATVELLAERGWCLWRCKDVLQGDLILLVDEQMKKEGLVKGMPGGFPVYTLAELSGLLDASDSAIRLIHEAKKAAGAEIVER